MNLPADVSAEIRALRRIAGRGAPTRTPLEEASAAFRALPLSGPDRIEGLVAVVKRRQFQGMTLRAAEELLLVADTARVRRALRELAADDRFWEHALRSARDDDAASAWISSLMEQAKTLIE